MTGRQRILAVLSGERADATPVMLHNFMAAAREAGVRMKEYRRDPRAIARVFVQAVETYGYDGVLVDIDTATLAGALGVPVEFPDDEPAVCRGALLDKLRDVERLPRPDVARHEGVQVWLEAVRILKRELGQDYFIRGNCDQAAFSLAALVRSAEAWMLDLMDPGSSEAALRLLDYCHEASAQFLRLMAAAGADMLSNGDSSAGTSLISPGLHRRFAHPYEARLAGLAHELGLPYALHVCGNARAILGDLCRTGADALELDSKTDAAAARDALGGRATFIGNIDPTGVLVMGTPAGVEAKCRELMAVFAGTPRFILNAGCALPAETPGANIHAMVRAARG